VKGGIIMSGAFVRDDEERVARLEAQTLTEKRMALLEMLMKKRERIETDPKLSRLPAAKKQEILDRIAHEVDELQEQLAVSSQV
jgi:DNA-binding response OmpR family regulator